MNTESAIAATFIPMATSSPLVELYALNQKVASEFLELRRKHKDARRVLAQRAVLLRRKVYSRSAVNGSKKERQALMLKSLEIDTHSRKIFSSCHKEALATIEAVCLSVFGESSELQNKLLAVRLSQSFKSLEDSRLSRLVVPKGSSDQIHSLRSSLVKIVESDELLAGQAVLETQSGQIKINITDDLREGFAALEKKLLEKLSSPSN